MKVLSITPAFAPQLGGIEQVVQELAVRLNRRGHQVDVAHLHPGHRQHSTDDVAGVRVFRLPLRGHRLIGWAPGLAALAKGYDLLHVHDPQLMAITANVRLSCPRLPAVLSTHGGFRHSQQLSWFKSAYERWGLGRALSHYKQVLASSVSDQAYFARHASHVALCSNGVNTDKFGAVPLAQDRSLTEWVYWGRLSHNKCIDRLIACVAQARQLGHSVRLLICGSDFDGIATQLHEQVRALHLEDAVRFEPYLSDENLRQELARCGVYATASEHEGFGLSIVEAMSAGLMILCRDMTPLNSFVHAGANGSFMRFDEGPADAQALSRMMQLDAAARAQIRQQARHTASAYNWEAAAIRFERHFQQALQAG